MLRCFGGVTILVEMRNKLSTDAVRTYVREGIFKLRVTRHSALCTLRNTPNAQAHVYTDRTPQTRTLIRRPTRSAPLVRQLPRRRPLCPIPPCPRPLLAAVRLERCLFRRVPEAGGAHQRRPAQRRDRPCACTRIPLGSRHLGCVFRQKREPSRKTCSSESCQKEAQDKT